MMKNANKPMGHVLTTIALAVTSLMCGVSAHAKDNATVAAPSYDDLVAQQSIFNKDLGSFDWAQGQNAQTFNLDSGLKASTRGSFANSGEVGGGVVIGSGTKGLTYKNPGKIGNGFVSEGDTVVLDNSGTVTTSSDGNGVWIKDAAIANSVKNSGSGSISGDVNAILVNGGVTELTNSANIQGGKYGVMVSGTAAKVETLANQTGGVISGATAGIQIDGTVTSLTNAGQISGNNGIVIGASGSVTTLNNQSGGQITGAETGILVNGSVTTLKNAGTVSGKNAIVVSGGHVESLAIEAGGQVSGTETGILVNGTVDSLTSAGTIKGVNAIVVSGEGAKVETIAVQSGGKIEGTETGILVNGTVGKVTADGTVTGKNGIVVSGSGATVGTITVESGGNVSGSDAGILVNTTATEVSVAGTVSGQNAVLVSGQGAKIGTLTVASGGVLHSTSGNGIGIADAYANGGIDNLSIASGGKVQSDTGYGIYVPKDQIFKSINIAGEVSGAKEGLYIQGTIGGENSTPPTLVIEDTAKITSQGEYGIYNEGTVNGLSIAGEVSGAKAGIYNVGTINGGVTYTGTKDLSVINYGAVNGQLIKNGSGKVTIIDWLLPTSESKVVVTGSHTDNIEIQHVSYGDIPSTAQAAADQSGIPLMPRLMVNDQAGGVTTLDANLSDEVQRYGFTSTFQDKEQYLKIGLSTEATAGGILGQVVANQIVRRDFTVDTMIDEAVSSALYHNKGQEGTGSIWVKPYGSTDRFEEQGTEFTGNTYGVLVGANYIQNDFGLTAFLGYEKSNLDGTYSTGVLNMDADTYYLGATGFANVASIMDNNVFVKVGAKAGLGRNSIDRTIGSEASSTDTNSVSWSVKAQLGVDWKLAKTSTITPSIGFGYASASIDDFGLVSSKETDTYNMNNVTLPYGEVALHWTQDWTQNFRTNFGGGMRFLFDKTQSMTSNFTSANGDNGGPASPTSIAGNYDLSSTYEYLTGNVTWALNKVNEVTFGYTGVFGGNGQSHNLTAKYEYLF